jgi:hypothetical protein
MQVFNLVLDDLRVTEASFVYHVSSSFQNHWVGWIPSLIELLHFTKSNAKVCIQIRNNEVKDVKLTPLF